MRRNPVAIIEGEEELGPQRRCSACGEWWPLSPEFFYRVPRSELFSGKCRACDCELDTKHSRDRRLRRAVA